MGEKESLQETATEPEKQVFTDAFSSGRTTAVAVTETAKPSSRRGSAVSQSTINRDRERELAFEQSIINLRLGHDTSGLESLGGEAVSRIDTRMDFDDAEIPPAPKVKNKQFDESLERAMLQTVWKELRIATPMFLITCESISPDADRHDELK